MKKFVKNILVLSLLLLISFYFVFLRADGYNSFYVKFATPPQTSLILGSSRAARAIQPKYLNKILHRTDFFNYSFTASHSPYGETYFKSIQRKLLSSTKNGIFIITIDPWSISSYCETLNDTNIFKEDKFILGTTLDVNENSNFNYLMFGHNEPYFNLLIRSNTFLYKDGWSEVNIPLDSLTINNRIKLNITSHRKVMHNFRYVQVRLAYLYKTIEFLNEHGTVYLVRLPIHPFMYDIENKLMPDFTKKMQKISSDMNAPYLDLTPLNSKFIYTDDNHISIGSGKEVTIIIGNWIKMQNSKTK